MSAKCRACGRFASNTEGARCTKCAVLYHRSCVNIPKEAKISSSWQCPECKVQTPRKDNTEDPVRGEGAGFTRSPGKPAPGTDVSAEIKEVLLEVRLHRAETQTMRGELAAFGTRLEAVESRLSALEAKPTSGQCSYDEVDQLRSTVESLKLALNDRDQESYANDLEITEVPEEQGENVEHLVSIIATKLGVSLSQNDIISVERAGFKRTPSSSASVNEKEAAATRPPRPRSILIRVAGKRVRDTLLQAARVRRGLTTDGMGLATPPVKFYVNERLSKYNKYIFFKAREEARSHGWKFVWSRGGHIYVRRDAGKAALRVRSEQDVIKIFGGEARRIIS